MNKDLGITSEAKALYEKLRENNGDNYQRNICAEELNELQKELFKANRSGGNRADIIKEIADVFVTMEQVILIHDINSEEIYDEYKKKLDRLYSKMEFYIEEARV